MLKHYNYYSIIINFLYNKIWYAYIGIAIYIDYIIIRHLTTNSEKYLNEQNGKKNCFI